MSLSKLRQIILLKRALGYSGMGRFRRNKSGAAAVEFALILPVMLLLYIGTSELTYGLMANRKMTLVSRALSDLTAQWNEATITDAELTRSFSAAAAIMSPFAATDLKMTISSIEFRPNTATPPVYTARTMWSATSNGGVQRPCQVLTKVSNTSKPTPTTLPTGLYGPGTIIVADVTFRYDPPFGKHLLSWSETASGIDFANSTYMKPRTQDTIAYTTASPPTGRFKCSYSS